MAGRRRVQFGVALVGVAGLCLVCGTSAGAADDVPFAPLVPEQTAYQVGTWASDIYPELDLLVSTHLDDLAWVRTTAEGTLEVGAPNTKLAERLVGEKLSTLKVPAAAAAKVDVVPAKRSARELYELMSALMDEPDFVEHGAGMGYIDPESDGVVLDMLEAPDAFRKDLYSKAGESVSVQLVESGVSLESGPQRDKDRYEYWGASSAYMFSDGYRYTCTAGVPMVRSNGDHIMVTAGHCTEMAASLNVYSKAGDGTYTNLVGNTYGLTSTFRVNVPNRGDIGAWKNNGSEGRIWMGGATGTTSAAIKATHLGTPDPDVELCFSGTISGVQCTFRVTGGGRLIHQDVAGGIPWDIYPLVEVRSTNACTTNGDSGGPWFNTVTGGVRVYGIHSGKAAADGVGGVCRKLYTPLWNATDLYDATVLTG